MIVEEAGTRQVLGLHEVAGRIDPDRADDPVALASAIDFVLEGLHAQKKITRSGGSRYQATEAPRRQPRGDVAFDQSIQVPGVAGRKKFYN